MGDNILQVEVVNNLILMLHELYNADSDDEDVWGSTAYNLKLNLDMIKKERGM